MDLNEYQKLASNTSEYPRVEANFLYPLLGLAGETGEVFEKVKKLFRDKGGIITPEFKEDITKELGDILWYLAMFALELEITLDEVGEMNIAKLLDRKKRGVVRGDGDNR